VFCLIFSHFEHPVSGKTYRGKDIKNRTNGSLGAIFLFGGVSDRSFPASGFGRFPFRKVVPATGRPDAVFNCSEGFSIFPDFRGAAGPFRPEPQAFG
ncbi:hypothetical protein, partial [Alistipes dispar]|uniref:hypothetical protein n=1 Tax=Alistipes dispar TaxID=2585119 RepID=UPI003A9320AE